MDRNSKIFIAGHRGMVGSAIVRKLEAEGYTNLITKTSKELDLRNQQAVHSFFTNEKPEYVFLAAAKVGGIVANNTYRADFLYENLMIQSNVIRQSYENNVKKLLFLGSSCIYPKMCPQPIKEEYLLTGSLEQTNEPYAIAKIAGLKMCEAFRMQYGCDYISVMPTNLYGPNDNYDLKNSHVLPALMRKFYEAIKNGAPEVEIWGSGKPMREFLHVDDLADSCYFLMNNYSGEGFFNIGTGVDLTIADLAQLIKEVSGYTGNLRFDPSKPDGTPRKLLDVTAIHNAGWKHRILLEQGVKMVWQEVTEKAVFA
ncbi:MAG: GDP-L-fucose synthase [Bacteroidetes bacterium]|nr:GDP-L-fucose synthase [Bacteroidota bacterium]